MRKLITIMLLAFLSACKSDKVVVDPAGGGAAGSPTEVAGAPVAGFEENAGAESIAGSETTAGAAGAAGWLLAGGWGAGRIIWLGC